MSANESDNPKGLGNPPSGLPPGFSLSLIGDWTSDQKAFACAACGRIERMLREGEGLELAPTGHSTLIVGGRALLAIGAVVFIALLLHTIFWSLVLPAGAIAS